MLEEVQTAPKVFISYSWDCPEHKDRVLLLANSLKKYGIDSKIDRYQQAPPEGWYRWMMNQIDESDFVLIVCTEKYNLRYRNKAEQGQGRGVTWEGGLIIAELYDGQGINDKYIPILLSPDGEKYIPRSLQAYTVYRLFDEQYDAKISGEFQNLYRHLSKQPEYEEPKLGKRIILPPIQPARSNVGIDGAIVKGENSDDIQKDSKQQQVNNPELEYRRKVEGYVNRVSLSKPYNEIPVTSKIALNTIRENLGLAIEKAEAIETDVLQTRENKHRKYKERLKDYEIALTENLKAEDPWSDENVSDLQVIQNNLGLDDKDATLLLLYSKLEYQLKEKSWRTADETTKDILVKAANIQQDKDSFDSKDNFDKIPCEDLHKLDELWTVHSNNHFGFSVQANIWKECSKSKNNFGDFLFQLGWFSKNENGDYYYSHISSFSFDHNAPKGQLPVLVVYDPGPQGGREAYIARIQRCFKISS